MPVYQEETVLINGIKHKIGAHGFAYALINGEWIKSPREPAMVMCLIYNESIEKRQESVKGVRGGTDVDYE